MRKTAAVVTGIALSAAGCSSAPSVGPTKAGQSPGPKPVTIDLQVIKRRGAALVVAPVVVHGKTYLFVVATGATATLVDQSYANAPGLKKTIHLGAGLVGLLGSDVLSTFGKITIDYSAQKASLG